MCPTSEKSVRVASASSCSAVVWLSMFDGPGWNWFIRLTSMLRLYKVSSEQGKLLHGPGVGTLPRI